MTPADREQRIALSRLRLAIGGKLSRAMRLVPFIDPGMGEHDEAGNEIMTILRRVVEDLDHLIPAETLRAFRAWDAVLSGQNPSTPTEETPR